MSAKKSKSRTASGVIQRKYSSVDLYDLWHFAGHDFDRFIQLIVWLDKLKWN